MVLCEQSSMRSPSDDDSIETQYIQKVRQEELQIIDEILDEVIKTPQY